MRLKTNWITLRIDPETKHFVKKMAKQHSISQSQFILNTIEHYHEYGTIDELDDSCWVHVKIDKPEYEALKLQCLLDGIALSDVDEAIGGRVNEALNHGCDWISEAVWNDMIGDDVSGLLAERTDEDDCDPFELPPLPWKKIEAAIIKGRDLKPLMKMV